MSLKGDLFLSKEMSALPACSAPSPGCPRIFLSQDLLTQPIPLHSLPEGKKNQARHSANQSSIPSNMDKTHLTPCCGCPCLLTFMQPLSSLQSLLPGARFGQPWGLGNAEVAKNSKQTSTQTKPSHWVLGPKWQVFVIHVSMDNNSLFRWKLWAARQLPINWCTWLVFPWVFLWLKGCPTVYLPVEHCSQLPPLWSPPPSLADTSWQLLLCRLLQTRPVTLKCYWLDKNCTCLLRRKARVGRAGGLCSIMLLRPF